MIAARALDTGESGQDGASLRFLFALTTLVALLGLGLTAWPMVGSLSPSAEVLVTRG